MLEIRNTQPKFAPDVYFTEGYGQAAARSIGGRWQTVSDPEGNWQMPLVVTELGKGLREAVSPYGYSGIYIGDDAVSKSFRVWEQARELLLQQDIVSLFLRFAPYDSSSILHAEKLDGLDVRPSGKTYIVKIQAADAMWQQLESRARNLIRKARKHETVATVRPAVSADFASGSTFRGLYEETMRRVGAADRYFFDTDYYSGLLSALGESLLVAEVHLGPDLVSAALIMVQGDLAHYHLSGSNLDGARLGATSLMLWSAFEWCASYGIDQFHLGGGLSYGDGLDKFKRSFGGNSLNFYTGRYIVDSESYMRLSRNHAKSLGAAVEDLLESEYFPAFRAPSSEAC